MKKLLTICVALLISLTASAQFRMIGTASWTTLTDSTYSATVNFQTDLTGMGYLATQVVDTFRLFTGTEQIYDIVTGSVGAKTFSSAQFTVVERDGDWGAPIGQVMVFDPGGRLSVPQAPFGSTGSTAQMQAAIDTYNARLVEGGFDPTPYALLTQIDSSRLLHDSILVSYRNGSEIDRDTIRPDLSSYFTQAETRQEISDSLSGYSTTTEMRSEISDSLEHTRLEEGDIVVTTQNGSEVDRDTIATLYSANDTIKSNRDVLLDDKYLSFNTYSGIGLKYQPNIITSDVLTLGHASDSLRISYFYGTDAAETSVFSATGSRNGLASFIITNSSTGSTARASWVAGAGTATIGFGINGSNKSALNGQGNALDGIISSGADLQDIWYNANDAYTHNFSTGTVDDFTIGKYYIRPVPRGTAQRPSSPLAGYTGYNSDIDSYEWYSVSDATWWHPVKTTLTGGDVPDTYVVRGSTTGGVTATDGLTYSGTVFALKTATRNVNFQNDVINFLNGASFGNFTLKAAQLKFPQRASFGGDAAYAALVAYTPILSVSHSYTQINATPGSGISSVPIAINTSTNVGRNGFLNILNLEGIHNDVDTNTIRSINIEPTLTASGQYEAIRIRPTVTDLRGHTIYAIRSDTGRVVFSNYEIEVEQDLSGRDGQVMTYDEGDDIFRAAPSQSLWNDFSSRTTSDTITVVNRQYIIIDATSSNVTLGIDLTGLQTGSEIAVNFKPGSNTATLETDGSEVFVLSDGSTESNQSFNGVSQIRFYIWDGTNLRY